MRLNNLSTAEGAKKARKRRGRGIGSSLGKTAGRGHKGQHSRSGGYHKVGFEGGQMPLQRRLPKVGFSSRIGKTRAEVRLHELAKLQAKVIDVKTLIEANIVPRRTRVARVINSGKLEKAVTVKGLKVSAGAREMIEKQGGKVEA